jgi:hypothetical protein
LGSQSPTNEPIEDDYFDYMAFTYIPEGAHVVDVRVEPYAQVGN